jgi:gliding motility-associated lipoprotein GldD
MKGMKRKRATFFWIGGFFGIVMLLLWKENLMDQVSYLPKPYGYHYIILPQQTYQLLEGTLPYRFEFSKHATWSPYRPYTSGMIEPYWITIYYPSFEASIEITYKNVKKDTNLLKSYLNDAYKLTAKHYVRAYEIEEQILQTPSGLQAALITINGQVATPYQFYTTDSVHHFLRGALYFNTAIANDSLAPIIDFIKKDIQHMLHTLEWKQPDLKGKSK